MFFTLHIFVLKTSFYQMSHYIETTYICKKWPVTQGWQLQFWVWIRCNILFLPRTHFNLVGPEKMASWVHLWFYIKECPQLIFLISVPFPSYLVCPRIPNNIWRHMPNRIYCKCIMRYFIAWSQFMCKLTIL